MEQYLRQGLISDSKVLDIRQVDVRSCLDVALISTLLTDSTGLRRKDTGKSPPSIHSPLRNSRGPPL